MPRTDKRRLATLAWTLAVLAGCATQPPSEPTQSPQQIRSEISRRMPASVVDREGWAADIQVALTAQRLPANPENICAVLAVIEQETGYQADAPVPNLAKVARREIDRRAAEAKIPRLAVSAALRLKSSDGRSYGERLERVRTERELSELYEELIGRIPMGERLLAGKNPVQTGGAMQVGIPFAEANARGYPYPVTGTIRDEVFTRRGGVYFGVMHLIGYETPYTQKLHRFADYNAGWYASRNAAFQNAVSEATGIPLSLDGDLLIPGAPLDRPGKTETAVRALAGDLRMDERAIRNALERSDRLDFSDGGLHERVFAIAESRAGKSLPRAVLPDIKLESPKITRELTTAWFADRVNTRYQRCMQR